MENLPLLCEFLENNGYSAQKYADKFSRCFELLIEWNEKFNLTAITDREGVETKHFIDSLLGNVILKNINAKSVCDIGCGAGFPSIPLALINPDINFTLVDSVNKKITFIEELKRQLALDNVECFHSRAEDFARINFQKFDCCVARAVAALPTLAEYTLPLVKKGGYLLAYKGINYQEELKNSQKILSILNSETDNIYESSLPDGEKRYILTIKKTGDCPKKYPRGGNKPRISPIV